jgi:hypothetical protein
MGKTFEEISPQLGEWITQQALFFVGSAPLSEDGHVNISPKGLDTLRVLGPRRVAYLDLTGSGAETIAHLRENGRIVVMFCAFGGPPRIVRLHGRGTVVTPASRQWPALKAHFPDHIGARSIVAIDVTRISDSCGYGVPTFSQPKERAALQRWSENKGPEGLCAYRRQKNARSVDGLPAFGADDEIHA